MRRLSGFTLIELVIVMIVISVGILGLTAVFSNTSRSLSANETLLRAAQYAQECAERAIATRRDFGFDWFATNTFSCGTNPSGFTSAVSVGNTYSGTGISPDPCPSGVNNCRNIGVTVTSTANASVSSSITIMLANY